ncbi:polysaccharide export protein [Thiohalobacter sp. IOR34]|uniref:XrtA/PEP-CTERM system exopolysaccharide export protein n=1 Tax=Thiohalobacter sp. IOR34 TaxID=3057176 RepID=UPI0025B00A40|nr:XrtA/PEP-CTERM system exopolysaccharide export protein [Thiohalobacter sp. IOR34]WJW74467.1 polysaccharide export protein [Thiohalobacter sp. IOR34]
MNTRLSNLRSHTFWILLLALGLLAGCSSTRYPAAPAVSGEVESPPYVIGPGDSVNIFVWRNEELSSSVPVRPDGRITTPLVEDLQAAGKTPSQLARDMEKALSTYVKNPVVTVIVTGFQGPYEKQIRVLGQAAQPSALPYRDKMTLLDVMIAVGGLTDFAAGNRAVVVRRQGDEVKQYQVRIDDLINGGDISANFAMMPGDILIIPEAWF